MEGFFKECVGDGRNRGCNPPVDAIDFNTLKHLVTDVPDPPMTEEPAYKIYIMQPSESAQQQDICVSSRTQKHLVTDVPDPPEDFRSASKIKEDLLDFEIGWSSSVKHFVDLSGFVGIAKTFFGATRFQYIYARGLAFVDQCLHAELFRKNQKAENKCKESKSLKTTSPWDKRSIVFLCLSLFLPISVCDDHMLSYYHTGLYNPEEDQYRFETVGYVDDQEIDMYSSESHVNIPKTVWMEENEGTDYWEWQTSLRKGWAKVFRENLMILASRFNYTKRFHALQLSYGCALYDDDSSTGHYRYGFDGKDFLEFDIKTLLWIPAMQKAEISAQRWNSDRVIGEGVKSYLIEHCTSALKKYIGYGRKELAKRVAPKVKIRSRGQDETTRLHCLVYGFHPRAVDVKWVRNGVDHVLSDEGTPILPHPDGTYQIRVSAEVPTKEGDTYSCHVDHISLEETLTVKWVPESEHKIMTSIIVIGVTGVVLLTILVTAALLLKRKSANDYNEYQHHQVCRTEGTNYNTKI